MVGLVVQYICWYIRLFDRITFLLRPLPFFSSFGNSLAVIGKLETIAREVSLSLSVIPKRTRNVWMGREWRVLGFSIRRGADRVFRMACIAYSWPVRVRNAAAAWGIRGEDRGCTIR